MNPIYPLLAVGALFLYFAGGSESKGAPTVSAGWAIVARSGSGYRLQRALLPAQQARFESDLPRVPTAPGCVLLAFIDQNGSLIAGFLAKPTATGYDIQDAQTSTLMESRGIRALDAPAVIRALVEMENRGAITFSDQGRVVRMRDALAHLPT
jgi:hypothetical protein